jgi:hypothetical protein
MEYGNNKAGQIRHSKPKTDLTQYIFTCYINHSQKFLLKLREAMLFNKYYSDQISIRWARHVARIGEIKNVYKILIGKHEGKKPLAGTQALMTGHQDGS